VGKATTDAKLIKKYWAKWPKAKIGMPLGSKSGFLAVRTDGSVGLKTLRSIEEKST
jgi:Bifunctional DNA primase/polymerase, N-terminal